MDIQTLDNVTLYRIGIIYGSWGCSEFSTKADAEPTIGELRKKRVPFALIHDYFNSVWVVIKNKKDGQIQGRGSKDAAGGMNEGENKPAEPQLPIIKGSDYERKVYEQALAEGMIQYEQGRWEWKSKNKLFGYFCGRLYCEDKIGYSKIDTDNLMYIRGCVKMPANQINVVFGVDINNLRPRDGLAPPRGYYNIDTIFNKASK